MLTAGTNLKTTLDTFTQIGSIYVVNGSSFTVDHDSADYISFRIVNDGTNQFYFLGGVVNIQKCTSGCGL